MVDGKFKNSNLFKFSKVLQIIADAVAIWSFHLNQKTTENIFVFLP